MAKDAQSQAFSVGLGKERLWSDLPEETVTDLQAGHVPPLGYEIDPKLLQELKSQEFVPVDELPTVEEDPAVSTLEPESLAPSLHDDFEGLDDLGQPDGYLHRPPDPHIAAGLNHIGVMVNSEFAFYTKAGTFVGEVSFKSWWSNVYTGTDLPFDPHITYDHHADRWLMVCLVKGSEPTSYYLLSVSQGSNPLGGWWNWRLNGGLYYGGSNTWADYPDLGFDGIAPASDGAIYISSNQFTWTNSFKTAMLNVLPKSGLYSGSAFTYWRLWGRTNNDGSQAFTLRTAWTHGNPGKEYLINSKSGGWDKVTLWNVVPDFTSGPTWTRQATVTIGTYSPPPDAEQQGGSATLDTIDNRIYNCMYRNGHLYAAFTQAYNWGSGTVAALRYFKINTATNSLVLNVIFGADEMYYWFPAIYTDMSDNIVIVFASSSATEYAGIRYTGRKTTDTSTQGSAQLKAGETYITGYRWGDFFGIARDPVNGDKVWIYGEWAKDCSGVSSTWDWGTWVGKVSFWPVGHQPIYSLRMSPYADIIHIHNDGQLLHGTDNYDGGSSSYHNEPVLGWRSGDDFYIFIDFLKSDYGSSIYYELAMVVGKVSTRSGSLYRTTDGKSWVGPTAITFVLASPDEPLTSGPSLASASTIEPKGWPPTYHFRVSPYVDVLHVDLDGAVINGVQNATSYHNQPVLGTYKADIFYITTDFTKDDNGDPIYYEMRMIVGHISTRQGSSYRTIDGMSVDPPVAVTLIPV